jgi:hypothetical protein
MSGSDNLSGRYIEVLRQLPQFVRTDHSPGGAVVHALTGASIQGHVAPKKREQGQLIVEFPGGKRFSTIGSQYLMLALKEAAEIELSTGCLAQVDGRQPTLHGRVQALHQHFVNRYRLGRFVWSPLDTLAGNGLPIPQNADKDRECSLSPLP